MGRRRWDLCFRMHTAQWEAGMCPTGHPTQQDIVIEEGAHDGLAFCVRFVRECR